ncbi:HSP18 transcriptional regulator [Kutzneria chonburiensis]|uniref:HSP18 transcriptional regulator n=1 Tax=Kutzneria chonburiensis TaxID=1483604 RepID=A0ABV6MRJ6_9PSEU|nr:HSP18 transcriptional regulator [Kutzneria chonburiensis]
MADEGTEREQARQWLVDRPAEPDTHDGDEAVTDLGLINQVTHHQPEHPDQDEKALADALAALTLLRHLRDELADWEPRLIAAARAHGASWIQLAPALGVASRQAAERRYLRLRPDDTGSATTGEQRVRAERDRRAGDRAVTKWARDNAIGLRKLAALVSALDGDQTLVGDAQQHIDMVTAALGDADSATLLGPLTDAFRHLHASHPDLADRIEAVTDEGEQARRPSS